MADGKKENQKPESGQKNEVEPRKPQTTDFRESKQNE